jgi:hypothetical protein
MTLHFVALFLWSHFSLILYPVHWFPVVQNRYCPAAATILISLSNFLRSPWPLRLQHTVSCSLIRVHIYRWQTECIKQSYFSNTVTEAHLPSLYIKVLRFSVQMRRWHFSPVPAILLRRSAVYAMDGKLRTHKLLRRPTSRRLVNCGYGVSHERVAVYSSSPPEQEAAP